jgi:hypothetical protein
MQMPPPATPVFGQNRLAFHMARTIDARFSMKSYIAGGNVKHAFAFQMKRGFPQAQPLQFLRGGKAVLKILEIFCPNFCFQRKYL